MVTPDSPSNGLWLNSSLCDEEPESRRELPSAWRDSAHTVEKETKCVTLTDRGGQLCIVEFGQYR
jgi:hypothetical protein